MSLSDYDFLPKVNEKTPCFAPEKSDTTSIIETPKPFQITEERRKEEERDCLTGSSSLKESEQLLTIDPSLASSEPFVSGILKKASSRDWDTKCPKNLTLNSTISQSPRESAYVRTPQPGTTTDTTLKPAEKSLYLRNQFISAAIRSAQNVPEERLQRKNEMKQLKRNTGAVVPLSSLHSEDDSVGCIGKILVSLSYFLIICFFPIAIIFCLRVSFVGLGSRFTYVSMLVV
jgi:hypothetical protein